MKKTSLYALLGALMLFSTALCGCSDNDDDDTNYYVRYSMTGTPGDVYLIYYTNAEGESELVQLHLADDGRFSATAGPVKAGFIADMTASNSDRGGAPDYMSIEVGRGSEPLVLKAHNKNAFSISYIIPQ